MLKTIRNLSTLKSLPLLAVAVFFSTTSAALEFKGIALGADYADFVNDSRYMCKALNKPVADKMCSAYQTDTIAGQPIQNIILIFYDDKLESISIYIKESGFNQAITALSAKYGAPKTDIGVVQNRMGAQFENRTYTWRFDQSQIDATQRASKVDQSRIDFKSDKSIQTFAERSRQNTSTNAKDL